MAMAIMKIMKMNENNENENNQWKMKIIMANKMKNNEAA